MTTITQSPEWVAPAPPAAPRTPSVPSRPARPEQLGPSTGARGLYVPSFVLAGGTTLILWIGATTLDSAGSLGSTLRSGWAELVAPMVLALVAGLLVCERLWPAERRDRFAAGHLNDAAFFALHIVAVIPLMTLLGVAFAHLLGGDVGRIRAPMLTSCPRWLLVAVTLVLMDGSNWLAHWADHRFTALWRMHAVHHSQQELSVLTSFRAHPLSHLPGFFLATIPVMALLGDQGVAPVLITGYVCLGTLPHANVPWTLGPLGKIVVSPTYHRLHHSIDGPDGYNLGVVLTVWDLLAGRALFPTADAPPCRTGLAGRPCRTEQATGRRWNPGTMFWQLIEPFRVGSPADRRNAPV